MKPKLKQIGIVGASVGVGVALTAILGGVKVPEEQPPVPIIEIQDNCIITKYVDRTEKVCGEINY